MNWVYQWLKSIDRDNFWQQMINCAVFPMKTFYLLGNIVQLFTPFPGDCPWWIPKIMWRSRPTRTTGNQALEVIIFLLKNSNFPVQDKETVNTTQERRTQQSVYYVTNWKRTIWLDSQWCKIFQAHWRATSTELFLRVAWHCIGYINWTNKAQF